MILKATLKGQSLPSGQVTNNVFYLESTGGQPGVEAVTQLQNRGRGLWRIILLSGLMPITASTFYYNNVTVEEVSGGANPGLSAEYTVPNAERAGTANTDPAPPFLAYSIRFTRPSNLFRHAYKRFGGVTEASIGGTVLEPGAATVLNTVGGNLLANFNPYTAANTAIAGETLFYVQINRNVAQPGAVATYARPVGVGKVSISSQNTRKAGRGS